MRIGIALLIAICWGVWPILLGKYKVPSPWGTLFVAIITVLPFIFMKYDQSLGSLSGKIIMIACIAGILNAIGLSMYPKLFMGSNPGIYIAIATACIPVMAVLGEAILNSSIPSIKQTIGIIVVVVGIILLQK